MTRDSGETVDLGIRIGRASRAGTVIALRGGLAAGKTTMAKGIAIGLGVKEEVTSPTFTLLNEYRGDRNFYHMDAYRLSGPEDFKAMGSDEVLYSDGVCAVEWSERVSEALPDGCTTILLEAMDDGSRRISVSGPLEEALR